MRLTVGEDTETILSSSRPEEHAPAGVPGDLSGQQAPLQRRQVGWASAQVDAEAAAAKPDLAVRRRGPADGAVSLVAASYPHR